ncbi:MAG: metallophosphoesterase, partial [Planctomycetota bacterium]
VDRTSTFVRLWRRRSTSTIASMNGPHSMPEERKSSRRRWLKRGLLGLGATAAGFGYGYVEASWLEINESTIAVPRLPKAFRDLRVTFISDVHHGPFTDLDYIRSVVDQANARQSDLILLGGDYTYQSSRYTKPCFEALSELKAPLGVYGVFGNHDHMDGIEVARAAMKESGIVELTNTGRWLERGDQRLRLGGVGDLWKDRQDLKAALGDTHKDETALVLSHNPDFAEDLDDERVGLVLSGHTHGGQVRFPIVGAPFVPSRYGEKFLEGLVPTTSTQVFVTRGIGAVLLPFRFTCRPEISVLKLV